MASMFLPSPKRLVAAALVFLLLAGGAFGVVGFASAGDGAAVSLPERHVGDAGTLEVNGAGEEVQRMDFEWLAPSAFKDEEGRWRTTLPFETVHTHEGLDGEEQVWRAPVHLDHATLEPVAALSGRSSASAWSSGPFDHTSESQEVQWFRFGGSVPCGFVNGLQGAEADGRVPVHCRGQVLQFRLQGTQATPEGEVLVLTFANATFSAQLWFLADVPYPVRTVLETDQGRPSTVEQRIIAFHRGEAPARPAPPPASGPLPEVGQAPRTTTGPDASGIDHPYPLAQALREAEEEADFPELREYLQRNPDAYLGAASYHQGQTGDGVVRLWWLEFSAEAESLSGHYGFYEWDLVHELRGTPVGDLQRQRSPTYRAHVQDGPTGPPVEQLPEELPRTAHVVAAWAAYAEAPPEEGMHIGFDLGRCQDGLCAKPRFFAGNVNDGAVSACCAVRILPLEEERHEAEAVRLVVDLEGRPQQVLLGTSTLQRGPGPAPPPGGAAEPEAPPRGIPLAGSVAWSLPSPEATAALTATAVLVALAYWLWPWLKVVPVALFSRVEGPHLAQHPQRRLLLDAIESEPGIHFHALMRRTGLANGTLVHHLGKLTAEGLVSVRKGPGRTCYFVGRPDRRVLDAAPVLRAEGARRILQEVLQHPGASAGHLSGATALSGGTVSHHLKRLRSAGLVSSRRVGRAIAVEPTEAGRIALGADVRGRPPRRSGRSPRA